MPPPSAGQTAVADPATEAMLTRLAHGLDIPPWVLGVGTPPKPEPEPPTPRVRAARRIGQAGWRIGYTVSQVGRLLESAGDRIIDAGDWLAGKVTDR